MKKNIKTKDNAFLFKIGKLYTLLKPSSSPSGWSNDFYLDGPERRASHHTFQHLYEPQSDIFLFVGRTTEVQRPKAGKNEKYYYHFLDNKGRKVYRLELNEQDFFDSMEELQT